MPAFCQAAVWTPFPRLLDNRITSFLLKQVADFEDQWRGEIDALGATWSPNPFRLRKRPGIREAYAFRHQ
jgi:hypothetical protein